VLEHDAALLGVNLLDCEGGERNVDFVDSEKVRLGALGFQAFDADLAGVVFEGF